MNQFKKHKILTLLLVALLTFGSYQIVQFSMIKNEQVIIYNASGEKIGVLDESVPVLQGKSYFLDNYSDDEQVYLEFLIPEKLYGIVKGLREGKTDGNFEGALGGTASSLNSIVLSNERFPILYQGLESSSMYDMEKQYPDAYNEGFLYNEIIVNKIVADALNLEVGQEIYSERINENLVVKAIISPTLNTTQQEQEFYQKYFLNVPMIFGSNELYNKIYGPKDENTTKIKTDQFDSKEDLMRITYYFKSKNEAEMFLKFLQVEIELEEIFSNN